MTPKIQRIGKYIIERDERGNVTLAREGAQGVLNFKKLTDAVKYAKGKK